MREAQTTCIFIQLRVFKVRFPQKNHQKIGFFGFKALVLVLVGGCCKVLMHVMKLHVIMVILRFMVHTQQAATKTRKKLIKKSFTPLLMHDISLFPSFALQCKRQEKYFSLAKAP
jgi:hypothetical protein